MNKLIVIIGPSGTKKTALSIDIAKHFDAEIINSDAFQVYKELNVGINKPSAEQLAQIPHHLINNISIFDEWDVSLFQKAFEQKYDEIKKRNHPIILCGGSHLYVDAIVSGYNFTEHLLDDLINELDQKYSNEELYDFIKEHDQEYSEKISVNNRRRLLRTVALIKTEKTSKTSIANRNKPKYKTLVIMTTKDREQLYKYLNKRTLEMLDNSWTNEVKELVNKYGESIVHLKALKAIGYPEVLNHVLFGTELNKELIQQKIRKLAKMQLTWCNNKFPNKYIFDYLNPNYEELYAVIKDFLND